MAHEAYTRAMSETSRPLIAVTMGDAAGIGPEIVVKALAESGLRERCRPVVIGASWAIDEAAALVGAGLRARAIDRVEDMEPAPGVIDVLDLGDLARDDVVTGTVTAAAGRASVEYIEEAARLALAGRIDAMATAPINKEAVQEAGYHGDIGHQEILGRMAGSELTATLLMTRGLRVAHLSTHKPLIEAARFVTRENVLAKLMLTYDSLRQWGLQEPVIAAAALNPHGGEGGLLGREEIEEIGPAVEEARARGVDARGPYPADSVFYRAIAGEFDAVLALYHDQGHIAIKVHDFEDSVTVTMGVPFIRTSVDHGTAFDIAGKGVANHTSLVRAIETAVDLAAGRLAPTASR